MTFLMVLAIILLALWLISLIRIGAQVRYGEGGLFICVLAGPKRIQLFPAKPKKKKKPKKEKQKKEPPSAAEQHEKEPEKGRPGR